MSPLVIISLALVFFMLGRLSTRGWWTFRRAAVCGGVTMLLMLTALFLPKPRVSWQAVTPTWTETFAAPSYRLLADLMSSSYCAAHSNVVHTLGGAINATTIIELQRTHPDLALLKKARCVIWLCDMESSDAKIGDGIVRLCSAKEIKGLWFMGLEKTEPSEIKEIECFEASADALPTQYKW